MWCCSRKSQPVASTTATSTSRRSNPPLSPFQRRVAKFHHETAEWEISTYNLSNDGIFTEWKDGKTESVDLKQYEYLKIAVGENVKRATDRFPIDVPHGHRKATQLVVPLGNKKQPTPLCLNFMTMHEMRSFLLIYMKIFKLEHRPLPNLYHIDYEEDDDNDEPVVVIPVVPEMKKSQPEVRPAAVVSRPTVIMVEPAEFKPKRMETTYARHK